MRPIVWDMELPRLDASARRVYETVLPKDARITTRSMFGGLGSFVNGNMFAGALGDRMFVRLPDPDREALLREPGGGPFEPVKGHAMAGYATIAKVWMKDPDRIREWMGRSLARVAEMPPKKPKTKAKRR
jgi:TfoX/Sxy family transcriptional regulator of competence genes